MKVRLRHQPLGVGLVLQNDSSFQMGFYFLANKGYVKIVNHYDLGEHNFVRCWLQSKLGCRSKIISSKLVMVTIIRILQFMVVANYMNAIIHAVLQILEFFL